MARRELDGEMAGARARPGKFQDPATTADGAPRAHVALNRLQTLWFNTGTLCNIECVHCYIESSPSNDRLVYLSAAEVAAYLDEIAAGGLATREIGLTGGEPFMNPEIIAISEAALARGHELLILTNAMRPMMRPRVKAGLMGLLAAHGPRLRLRVSLDHWSRARHDEERGAGGFDATLEGLRFLVGEGFAVDIAARTMWGEDEAWTRARFAALFAELGIALDADDPTRLVLFPEMDEAASVPEITEACWGVLGKTPDQIMCASSRMVVKRKGADAPTVVACTLLPYDRRFELGSSLAEAARPVALNHPHCARFCVLGGGSCSGG